MEENKDLSKYNSLTKEKLEKLIDDVYKNKERQDRNFKCHIYFNSQEQADDWMKMFNNLLKEEAKKLFK